MNCAQAQERRWRRLDAELTEEEAAQLDEHERACAACRERSAKAERLHGLLRKSYQEKPLAAQGPQAEGERRGSGLLYGSTSPAGSAARVGGSLPPTRVLAEMLQTTSGQAALGAFALSLGVLVYFGSDILSALSDDKARGSLWALRRTAAESSEEGRPSSPGPTALDYARDANKGALSATDGSDETEAGKAAAGGGTEGKGEEGKEGKDADKDGRTPHHDSSGGSFSRPSLVPSQALRSAGSSSGSSAGAAVPGGQVSGGADRAKALAFAKPQAGRGTSMGRSGAGARKALSQLKLAEKVSRSGVGMGTESGRATEARAFEGAGKGAGVGGLGLSGGGLGNSLGDVSPNPNPDIKNNTVNPVPQEVEGTEVTPYDWMISLARMALLLADLLLAVAAILSWNKALTETSVLLVKAAMALAMLCVGMGLAVMMMYGQIQQGMILMLAGGVAAGAGALALNGVPAASLILLVGAAGSSLISGITMSLADKL